MAEAKKKIPWEFTTTHAVAQTCEFIRFRLNLDRVDVIGECDVRCNAASSKVDLYGIYGQVSTECPVMRV